MDFVVGLPRTVKGCDSIWIIVDCLTKSTHFLPVDTRYSAKKYAKLYFDRIVTLHGVPLTIVSDRGSVFVSHFCEQLQKCLGTSLLRSLAYHPQTDGQTERVNQVLKDMLRACAISLATKKASAWHHLKLYMEEGVGHHATRLKWETMGTLGLNSSKRLESKQALLGVT